MREKEKVGYGRGDAPEWHLDECAERQGWSFLSESAMQRVWDNEEDAVYDNWRESKFQYCDMALMPFPCVETDRLGASNAEE